MYVEYVRLILRRITLGELLEAMVLGLEGWVTQRRGRHSSPKFQGMGFLRND